MPEPDENTAAAADAAEEQPGAPTTQGAGGQTTTQVQKSPPALSPAGLKELFNSLSISSFRNLWLGMLLQMGGMQVQMMVRGYFVYQLTESPILLGVVSAPAAVPALVFGLFGGVLADRVEKKRIIQAGQAVSVLLALFVAISITTGVVTWHYLLVSSIIQGGLMPVMMPARQSIIPQLVSRERLMNAVALNSMGRGVTTLFAPAMGGGFIVLLGVDGAYYALAAMFVGSMMLTALLPKIEPALRATRTSILADLFDGLRYIRSTTTILQLLLLSLCTTMLAMPIRFILPIFAEDVFTVGADGLGLMMSAMGLGSLGGAVFIAATGRSGRRGLLLTGSSLVTGGSLLGFAVVSEFAPFYMAALGILAVVGLFEAGRMTLNNGLLIEYTEDRYRGRVMSVFVLNFALMPMGVLPLTLVADWIGAPQALGIMALLLIAISTVFLIVTPHLRRLQ